MTALSQRANALHDGIATNSARWDDKFLYQRACTSYKNQRNFATLMNKEDNYQVIRRGIENASEAPRDNDIYYRCVECGGVIYSNPKKNVGCACGNIFIDFDYFRLAVRDLSKFDIVRMIKSGSRL